MSIKKPQKKISIAHFIFWFLVFHAVALPTIGKGWVIFIDILVLTGAGLVIWGEYQNNKLMAKNSELFTAMSEMDPEMAARLDFSKIPPPSYKSKKDNSTTGGTNGLSSGTGYSGTGYSGGGDLGGGDCGGGGGCG
ncbi:MAG: hypothetical protein HQL69_19110 [Magnetococcales bacterium]|nr:hypothetical protein [Magnetococcales bacterium]